VPAGWSGLELGEFVSTPLGVLSVELGTFDVTPLGVLMVELGTCVIPPLVPEPGHVEVPCSVWFVWLNRLMCPSSGNVDWRFMLPSFPRITCGSAALMATFIPTITAMSISVFILLPPFGYSFHAPVESAIENLLNLR
jgi:hypothetical protein